MSTVVTVIGVLTGINTALHVLHFDWARKIGGVLNSILELVTIPPSTAALKSS